MLEAKLYPARDCRGRDRMVSGFTTKCALMPITTKVDSSNPRSWRAVLGTTLCDTVC